MWFLNFSYRLGFLNLIVGKVTIVNSQFTKLPTIWFKKPGLGPAVNIHVLIVNMRTINYLMMIMMIK